MGIGGWSRPSWLRVHLQIGQAIEEVNSSNQELLRKYRRELQLRKKCHNELVRLKGDRWMDQGWSGGSGGQHLISGAGHAEKLSLSLCRPGVRGLSQSHTDGRQSSLHLNHSVQL